MVIGIVDSDNHMIRCEIVSVNRPAGAALLGDALYFDRLNSSTGISCEACGVAVAQLVDLLLKAVPAKALLLIDSGHPAAAIRYLIDHLELELLCVSLRVERTLFSHQF